MKTILIPTDFSTHSLNAIDYAASLAEKMPVKLILLHMYHVPVVYTEVPVVAITDQDFEAEADVELKRQVEHIQSSGKVKDVSYINREGLLVDTISDIAAENKVDLIVMGTQGASGLEKMLIGSYTAAILDETQCPVLIVPAGVSFKGIKKIMYATDFQFNDFTAINQVADIARFYDAEIVVTHISTAPAKEEATMDWFMEIAEANISYPNVTFRSFAGADVSGQLTGLVKGMNVDLLCMSTVRRTFFEKLYKSSLTKKMVYQAEIPILAFHVKEPNRL
ncbi:universal stress protein [Rhodocytophaga rosea]|uniref:Universal stress protein n=1 Tax=Rhodocytophaga rosea TaxID=2704465 RepID=A0A6C0GU10_9BACT|nr:universal stress protein [Rhodocytophaga rosea]QHT71304.1 universal stress protein [Rhodocytophaga rosea]